MHDAQHQSISHTLSEVEHKYGDTVHVLSDPYLLSLLARLCHPDTVQPEINRLVDVLYRHLVGVVAAHEFPRRHIELSTRMRAQHEEAIYSGQILEPDTPAVVVDIARAGMFPSQIVYDHLNVVLNPQNVRQDHIFMNRKVDEQDRVVGADVSGTKIGGPIEDAFVVLPDPMGATGGSMISAIELYRERGRAARFIAVHLIITPEYVKAMKEVHPEAVIYAVRLDRGLSPPDVLDTVPGLRWNEERGLNAQDYIVPGGGGFGEIMNNAFV